MIRLISFLILCLCFSTLSAQTDVRPFLSHNQSPLIHSFGLPNAEGGRIIDLNELSLSSTYSLVSNSTSDTENNERVYFDGEMIRTDFQARYGISSRFEIGINIPLVNHSGGFMDSSIDSFHQSLGFDEGARARMPKNAILYAYKRNKEYLFYLDKAAFGLGDISFEFGFKLLHNKRHSMALRAYLKLNTGNKQKLMGSGSLDISCQLSGQITGLGSRPAYLFYSLAYLRVGSGSLLESIQNRNIISSSLGFAVKANSWLVPKIQFDYHTQFYKNTLTEELGLTSIQMLLGMDFILNDKMILTGGFAEDIKVNTSPDFILHLGMNYTF